VAIAVLIYGLDIRTLTTRRTKIMEAAEVKLLSLLGMLICASLGYKHNDKFVKNLVLQIP
jgi:hypothetical protein